MRLKYFNTERVLPCNVSQLFIASSRFQFRFMEEDDWIKGLCYRNLLSSVNGLLMSFGRLVFPII